MRRKLNQLLPLELSILAAGLQLARSGERSFHGYQLAKLLGQRLDARNLIGYGTLYKALERLEKQGALESGWEHPDVAERERRPRRRLYRVTALGAKLSLAAPASAHNSSVRRTKAYPA